MKNDIRSNIYNSDAVHALCLIGAFGLLSVLIDLDHIPVLIQKGLSINPENLITYGARTLHLPFFILLGLLCVYFGASLYRLRNSSL